MANKLTSKIPRFTINRIVWILVFGILAYRAHPQVMAALSRGDADTAAPGFELRTLSGETVSLDAFRGQVVLLNFWATWCPPCRVEMPSFQRVYESKADQGFVVLAVSTDVAGESVVRDFITERGFTFPVAMATGRVVHDYGGVRALPTSFLIDRNGHIRHAVKGFFAEPALRLAVNRLLAEPAPAGQPMPAPAAGEFGAPPVRR